MLTRAQRALQAETGAVSPERLRALRFALLARRDDAREAAKGPGLDERFAASLRGKAKGYQEAADLVQQLLYGAPMPLPRWSTARKKARAYQERRRARIAARSGQPAEQPDVEYDIQDDLGQPYWIDRRTGEHIDPTGGFMNALRDSSSTD